MTYSPPWAPHVVGEYNERIVDEDGAAEQRIAIRCSICGGTYQVVCTSGAVRRHIQNFAVVHTHRDAMNDPIGKVRPPSSGT